MHESISGQQNRSQQKLAAETKRMFSVSEAGWAKSHHELLPEPRSQDLLLLGSQGIHPFTESDSRAQKDFGKYLQTPTKQH